jgi:photosystem II stability/assembly factor-like uncharacterized protein
MTSPTDGWALLYQPQEDQVLQTTDGGRAWRVRETTSLPAVAVTAPDASHIFVLANDCGLSRGCSTSILYASSDDGASWHAVWRSTGLVASSVTFVNTQDGYMLATRYSAKLGNRNDLLHTTDGGIAWTSIPFPCTVGDVALSFKTDAYGWLLCGGGAAMGQESKVLYQTTTGGKTWGRLSTSGPGPGVPKTSGGLPLDGYVALVTVVSPGQGFVGLSRLGVLRSADGGERFSQAFRAEVPVGSDLVLSLGFLGSRFGWLTGGTKPYLYTTDDGGQRWNVIHPMYASGPI